MSVFVLDRKKHPLMPCSEKRARLLLERGRAIVVKIAPFTIRLKDRLQADCQLQPVRVKLDPGSKTTGIAVVREDHQAQHTLALIELVHRGKAISDALTQRRAFRRARRNRNTRYRAKRFKNRRRPEGWLVPSLRHRVETTQAWVARLCRVTPVGALSLELVKFDTQALDNPDISPVEHQQGTLAGYEVREYLLEKWNRCCAYCGTRDVPLQIDHIVPKAVGGSNRIANLVLACRLCNAAKGSRDVREFLAEQPERLHTIQAHVQRPLRDVAAVNATRWALLNTLKAMGRAVETASGGRTKYNRSRLGLPKTHALDAACVGKVDAMTGWQRPTLTIKTMGRGSYQRTRLTKHGFPRGYLTRQKRHYGFQTGDLVHAIVPRGKKQGSYVGRVAIRASGSFNIQSSRSVVQGISYRHCRLLQRNDGYSYFYQPKGMAASRPVLSSRD